MNKLFPQLSVCQIDQKKMRVVQYAALKSPKNAGVGILVDGDQVVDVTHLGRHT